MTIKQRRFKCIECINKGDELCDVFTYYMKLLKYDPSWHWIENICHIQLKNNIIRVKVHSGPNVIDYCFTNHFSYKLQIGVKKKVLQKHQKIENIKHGLWMNIMFPPLQWDEVHSGLVMAKKWATLRTCVIQNGLWPCVMWKKIETTKGIHLLNLLSEKSPKIV